MSDTRFLVALTAALVKASQDDPPKVAVFTEAMDKVLPVFDHLGTYVVQAGRAPVLSAIVQPLLNVYRLCFDICEKRYACEGALQPALCSLCSIMMRCGIAVLVSGGRCMVMRAAKYFVSSECLCVIFRVDLSISGMPASAERLTERSH
jgi:hypothetical protein